MKTILIIESINDDLELIKEILEEAGHTVLGTLNEKNAMEILRQGVAIDVVLVSFFLEKKNDFQIKKFLDENTERKDIPVVALLSTSAKTESNESLQKGYHAYIVKPIDETAMLECIQNQLAR